MATSARIALISTVLTLAMTHYTLADGECPDDNTNLLDETGCPTKDISVMMISFPPYVIFEDDDNGEQFARGIVYDYIHESFQNCCPDSDGNINLTDTKTETSETFEEDLLKADIIFPVTDERETILTYSGIHYTFHDIVKSNGYVLIGLIDQYNTKARDLVLDSLYDSWPIFALTFLLAAIAGIFIWALVC